VQYVPSLDLGSSEVFANDLKSWETLGLALALALALALVMSPVASLSVTKGAEIPRYKRPKTMSNANMTDEQFTQWYNKLDRAMFWGIFLFHTNHNIENVIDEITGGVLAHDTYRWGRLRIKPNDAVRTYKAITIKNFIVSPPFSSVSPIYPGSWQSLAVVYQTMLEASPL
jgi:hypothetical protein